MRSPRDNQRPARRKVVVFDGPQTADLLPVAHYLSCNVRHKLPRGPATHRERFVMTIDRRQRRRRGEAGEHLRDLLTTRLSTTPPERRTQHSELAQLAGLEVCGETSTVVEDLVVV